MRKLNIRRLIVAVALLAAIGVGTYLLHNYQVRRNAQMFLREASRAREAGHAVDAMHNLQWYVRLVPGDIDSMAELGLLQVELEQWLPAFRTLENVLRKEPARADIRRRVVPVAMQLQRYSDAREHLEEYLLHKFPNDVDLLSLLAVCQVESGDFQLAVTTWNEVIQHDPERVEAYDRVADVARRHLDRPEMGDRVIEQMVEANPASYKAYLFRAQYRRRYGEPSEALADAVHAAELAPDQPDALLLAAQCSAEADRLEDAQRYALRGIEVEPRTPELYKTLAIVEQKNGDSDESIRWLNRGLSQCANEPGLLWALANLQIDLRDYNELESTLRRLRQIEYPEPFIEYLKARVDLAESRWQKAVRRLERCRAELTALPDLVKQADFWLGRCYAALGNPDMQLAAFRRAVDADPFWTPARLGLAEAQAAVGHIDEALAEQLQILKLGNAPPETWLQLARLMIVQNLRRDRQQRRWQEIEEVLKRAEAELPNSPEVVIVRAEMLLGRNLLQEAGQLLAAAVSENAECLSLRLALARFYQRQQNWDLAEETLERAQRELGDSIERRLAVAQVILARNDDDAGKRLQALSEPAKNFSTHEMVMLWRELAVLAFESQRYELCEALCRRVINADENNLQARLLQFDLACHGGDAQRTHRILEQIRQIDGTGAVWNYGKAAELWSVGDDRSEQDSKRALEYLAEAKNLRPGWYRAPLLAGEIQDQLGQPEAAVENYLLAIEQGARNPRAFRRAVRILYDNKRFLEADRLIRRAEQHENLFGLGFGRLAAELSVRLADLGRALELAQRAESSEDFEDHIWRGQLLGILAQYEASRRNPTQEQKMLEAAEDAFRRAIDLQPTAPGAWVALIQFYARTEGTQKAQAAIADARARLPEDDAPLAMAQCYEAIGNLEKAEVEYQAALKRSPDEAGPIRLIAEFYLRQNQPRRARPYLERLIDLPGHEDAETAAWARRQLASTMASGGDYQQIQDALALIEQNLREGGKTSLKDRRAKALVLASHPSGASRRQAIREFEALHANGAALEPADKFLLARLYLAENDWAKGAQQMRTLLADHGNHPPFVIEYVNALLEHNELHEAELWLKRLEKIAPESIETAVLRAKMLVFKHRYDEATRHLLNYVDRHEQDGEASRPLTVAVARRLQKLAETIDAPQDASAQQRMQSEAEKLVRSLAATDHRARLALVDLLTRQGRTRDALAQLETVRRECSPSELADALLAITVRSQREPTGLDKLESTILDALKQHERTVTLLYPLAELRIAQQRYADAEDIYREIIQQNDREVAALNNLALLLAFQREHADEALPLINRAIAAGGPRSMLLDSRACVYLALGQPDRALDDLNEALADRRTPARYFHLAQAYRELGRNEEADEALDEAQKLGLDDKKLHPLERAAYHQMGTIRR